ncbi:MAG TPA: SDR family NAD(P)-dependent oxidoreductase, partial [Phototrophicaceae bacterium]|nr:SDR family NAD(P)-dependent oxidoreductase [Phototrophicaceae bacterium]
MTVLDMFRLDRKVALVTGANRGLGQSIAVALAEAGADIAGLSSSSGAAVTQNGVTAAGRRYVHLTCNLAEATVATLNEVVEKTVSDLGRVDILVNNAGIVRRTPALEYSEKDW